MKIRTKPRFSGKKGKEFGRKALRIEGGEAITDSLHLQKLAEEVR
jgi:hypothetical protein